MKTIEEKARAYDEALEKAKEILEMTSDKSAIYTIFSELEESEDEKVRKELIKHLKEGAEGYEPAGGSSDYQRWLAWLEKQKEPLDKGEISDGYHTFNELYYYRMLYNAAFFNLLPKEWVHKSKKHHTGEECFGGGWFIVMAELPTGQISNHYEMKDWDLFDIPEKEVADKWDGHTPQEAADRLYKYLLEKQGEQKFEMKTAEESLGIDSDTYNKIVDECIFGEEDDKVRTTIINEFEQCSEWCCANGLTKEDCIDWLQSLKGRIQPKQGWSEDDNLYYDDICEILMNLLHSERTDINKTAVQKDLDWLGRIKEKTQKNKEDATADEIINYFKCQTRDEPSRRDTHNKWISWVKNKK